MRHKLTITLLFAVLIAGISLQAQGASIFFSVNMSYQIQLGNFNPSVDFVDVAGTFNDWGSDLSPLSDDNNDSIYTTTISGFSVQQYIEFKFRMNGVWDGSEEFPGGGPNRTYTVISEHDSIYFWYSDMVSPNGPPIAYFSVSLNQVQSESSVDFRNLSSGNVEWVKWYFEGGLPETSQAFEPHVFYKNPGLYDVQLIVGNQTQSDTLYINNYLSVILRDTSQLNWWNHSVFYEIFVRSFYDSDGDGIGDFNGLTEKLDYLNDGNPNTHDDLGITGIWLMPIHPSPSYHGYDVTNYRAINPQYGTMEEFKTFLNAAHSRGIKVIIDFVMNHTSSQHPWFIDSQNNTNGKRNFYRWSLTDPGYLGPWGQVVWHYSTSGYYYGLFYVGMPDLNYEEPQVKDTMFQTADYWLNDIGVDGFRLDAARYIFEDGSNLQDVPATIQFWKDFNTNIKEAEPSSFCVGEVWTNTASVLNYVKDGGLDLCFEFDLSSRILEAAGGGNAINLRDQMSFTYNGYPDQQWATFLTNHEMDRVMNTLGQDDEKSKLAASIYLTLPGVPFIYYGEEIGMLGEKPDENIRKPMQWSNTYQGGFTTGTPWINLNSNYFLYNVETERQDTASIFNRYKKMLEVRRLKPSLQTGSYLGLISNKSSVFSFVRATGNDTAIVVINTAGNYLPNVSVDLTTTELSPGQYTWWEMMKNEPETLTVDQSQKLLLPSMDAYEVNIFSFDEASGIPNLGQIYSPELSVYPDPTTGIFNVQFKVYNLQRVTMKIYNMYGWEVAVVLDKKLSAGEYKEEYNASFLPDGMYFLKLTAGKGTVIQKIVKM